MGNSAKSIVQSNIPGERDLPKQVADVVANFSTCIEDWRDRCRYDDPEAAKPIPA